VEGERKEAKQGDPERGKTQRGKGTKGSVGQKGKKPELVRERGSRGESTPFAKGEQRAKEEVK